MCDVLSSERHCIAVDLRGHGDSEWSRSGDYTLDAHVSDVRAVVEALSLGRPFVVGHSLGGLVAVKFAAQHGRQVRGLVLVDTGPSVGREHTPARLRELTEGPTEHATIEEFVERAHRFNPRRPKERLRRSIMRNLRSTGRGTWTWKYDPRVWDPARTGEGAVLRRSLVTVASHVVCPVLVVRGEESEHLQEADAEASAALFRYGRWLGISGAGHTIQGDRPYELAVVIRDFVGSTKGKATRVD